MFDVTAVDIINKKYQKQPMNHLKDQMSCLKQLKFVL